MKTLWQSHPTWVPQIAHCDLQNHLDRTSDDTVFIALTGYCSSSVLLNRVLPLVLFLLPAWSTVLLSAGVHYTHTGSLIYLSFSFSRLIG